MDEKQSLEQNQPKFRRSPNFPSLPLDKAIDNTRKLYEKYSRTAVPMPVAMEFLGYSTKSSSGLQLIAALSAYGLMIAEGSGKDKRIKLSNLGFTIIKNPNQNERDAAIKSAALNPYMFNFMMGKYNNQIPDENILKYDLEADSELGFNPKSIPDFIDTFLKTISFAKISKSDIIESDGGQNVDDVGDSMMTNVETMCSEKKDIPSFLLSKERAIATYTIGRGLTARILISGEQPTTKKSISKLIKFLQDNEEDLPESLDDDQNETSKQ